MVTLEEKSDLMKSCMDFMKLRILNSKVEGDS